jgi:hypothetical protein
MAYLTYRRKNSARVWWYLSQLSEPAVWLIFFVNKKSVDGFKGFQNKYL